MRGLDEDTFQETWKNLMWTYNTELNYVEITVSEDGDLAITESSYWNTKNRVVASARRDKYF